MTRLSKWFIFAIGLCFGLVLSAAGVVMAAVASGVR